MSDAGAYTWADPRFSDPNWTPPGWGSGSQQPSPSEPAKYQAPPPPPPSAPVDDVLGRDPAYQAFKRALGLEDSTAKNNTQAQVDALNRQLPIAQQWLGFQNDRANRGISGSMEARGIYRSGETNTNLGNQAAAYGHSLAGLDADTQNRIAALQQALAQQEAGFGTQDAEQQQAAYGRQALADQQAAINDQLTKAMAAGQRLPDLQSLLPGGVNTTSSTGSSSGPANLAAFHLSPSEAYIVSREDASGNTSARNPTSGAFGIGQLNPSSGTLQSIAKETGYDPNTTDAAQQVAMMRRYIQDRYGSADAAAAHERKFGWY